MTDDERPRIATSAPVVVKLGGVEVSFYVERTRKRERDCKACGRKVRAVVIGRRHGDWTGTAVCVSCLGLMAKVAVDVLGQRPSDVPEFRRAVGRFIGDLLGLPELYK